MIATDFAPNETWSDALISVIMMLQPFHWTTVDDNTSKQVEKKLIDAVIKDKNDQDKYSTYLYISGRGALFHLINSLKHIEFTDVLIQSFTCAAVPLPIIAAGKNPVYVDIEPEAYSMNFEDLKKKYSEKAKVLILQHTYGLTPAHRDKILQFAEEKNLFVIEDLAHGWNDKGLGVKTALVSFGRSKAISSVFGGAVISSDSDLKKKLAADYASLKAPSYWFIFRALLYKPLAMIIKSTYESGIGKILHYLAKYLQILIPEITSDEKSGKFNNIFAGAYPYALAPLLLKQLDRLPTISEKRKKAVSIYSRGNTKNLITRYPVRISNRQTVMEKLAKESLYLGNWYNRPVGGVKFDLEKVGYIKGSCPLAEKISGEIINLPTLVSGAEASLILKLTEKYCLVIK